MATRRTGATLVIAAAVLWSTGGVGVKMAGAEPLVVAGLRSVFALFFMSVVLLIGTRRASVSPHQVARLLGRPLVWLAAASYALMLTAFVLSARRTTAANAIFIQSTGPVYVALLSGPVLGERVARSATVAVALCAIGMALAFGGELGPGKTSGNVLALCSSFGFAGLPLSLRLEQKRRPLDAAAPIAGLVAMCLGNALAFVAALPSIVSSPALGTAGASTLLVVAALGTFQIGLPYVLYGTALRTLRALEASLLAMIEPVLAPVWVFLAMGERPSGMAVLGGLIIVAAVAGQAVKGRRD